MGEASDKRPLRKGVIAIFANSEQQILVGKRKDIDVWQLPQGGVDEGESLREALVREVREELGEFQFDIMDTLNEPTVYLFPQELDRPITKAYRGQQQYWFLCRIQDDTQGPNLDNALDDEFVDLKWDSAQNILANITPWKHASYQKALSDFGFVSPSY
ncbi:MAG: NUDIX domain-containing protein [Zetaproteobacteria bacterium]|nr:NUDIX domain-containing protein [Zetaproteobacteria bacterium]